MDLAAFLSDVLNSKFEEMAVLKASDRGTVTMIRHKESRKKYILRRFEGNADVYKALIPVSNPHLPRVYETVQLGKETVALTEYILGDSLAEILEGGALPPDLARKYFLQLAEAVYVLHGQGVIHRDIKPDNVLIRGDHVWLIDFDAARLENPPDPVPNDPGDFRETAAGKDTRILGTIGYAPPEQFGISRTDKRSDIYAMGILLNEMLTREHPSVKQAAGRLGRIVQKCTMTAAEKRYPSVRAVINAL